MDTSVAVKALLSIAALSAVTAFFMSIINERRQRDFLSWVRTARPAAWQLLPRTIHLLPSTAAVTHLRRLLPGDVDFEVRDTRARRGRPAMLAALLTGLSAIGVTFVGVALGIWSI